MGGISHWLCTMQIRPYRQVARRERRISSLVAWQQACCWVWPRPPVSSSPPFHRPAGGKVPGAPAGGTPLTAEAPSGKPCGGSGSPVATQAKDQKCSEQDTRQEELSYGGSMLSGVQCDSRCECVVISSKSHISVQLFRQFPDALLQLGRDHLLFLKAVNV